MNKRPKTVLYLLLACCFLATAQIYLLDQSYEQAGAMRRDLFWAGDYWRAIKSVFIHGGWVHLALNGLALFVLGRPILAACGRLVLVLFTLAAAEAGMAASLLATGPEPDPTWRVGISGGVAGLVGLIFAIEWTMARGWRSYLRRRNVRVLGFFLALNVALAFGVEALFPGLLIDHAAHVGGLLLGLVAGLVWFTKSGPRVVRGVAVTLLLSVLPISYAAYPYFNAEFFRERAERFFLEQQRDDAAAAFERVLALEPGDYLATARLAQMTDDPARLDPLGEPLSRRQAVALEDACLELATNRLESDPETALRLVNRARPFGGGNLTNWRARALAAEQASQRGIARLAYREALRRARTLNRTREEWRSAWRVIEFWVEDPERQAIGDPSRFVRDGYELASIASLGLREGSRASSEERRSMEKLLALFVAALAQEAAQIEPTAALCDRMTALRRMLAENVEDLLEAAVHRLDAARWAERSLALQTEPTPREIETVEGLYRGAYAEGRESGQAVVVAQAGHWLRAHGIEPPEPDPEGDLAPEAGGG